MKIICVIGSLGGGGAERVMAWLVNRLANSGHEVTLFTQNSEIPDAYDIDTKVKRSRYYKKHYFDSSFLSSYINTFKWLRFIRNETLSIQPSVVLSFIDSMNVQCLLALAGARVNVVVSERTDPAQSLISKNKKYLLPFLYRTISRKVVFQTKSTQKKYSEKWSLVSSLVIPNAVLHDFCNTNDVPRTNTILSVGRLDYQKGHDLLIQAWARICNQSPDWTLRIVGNGPECQRYSEMIDKLGVSDSVTLAEFSKNILPEYIKSSIFVLPSRVEGFPNALIEAMACRNPVIASSSIPANLELIQPGVSGLLFDTHSVDDLARKILCLIKDEQLRATLAENATYVREAYSEETVFNQWMECLSEASLS